MLQDSELYRVGQAGVREMVAVSDPSDPFPVSVLGGIPIQDLLLDLERFSADPSFGGQIAIERRGKDAFRAWSVHDMSDRSLTVHQGPGEDIVAQAIDKRSPPRDPVREPAPVVPVPVLAKYVNFTTVTLTDSSSQACGVGSERSTGESVSSRVAIKVGNYPKTML